MTTLTSTSYGEAYYQEHRRDGLDYAVYGEWQRDYGRWLVESLGLRGGTVLDVGCACGSIANGIKQAGADNVCGIDLCEPMIARGRAKFKSLRLDVCDAANLHLFHAGDFDFLHTNNVAEHWPADLVPRILRELHRVARPDVATLLLCLDTEELYQRQGRDPAKEDPTHVCIRPWAWWESHLERAGWRRHEWAEDELRRHPLWAERWQANDWELRVYLAASRPASVREVLASVWHAHDADHLLDHWLPVYEWLADEARRHHPRRIIEIGARAGYSAAVFRWACPDADILCLDGAIDDFGRIDGGQANSHGGFAGAWRAARSTLDNCRVPLLVVDSHAVRRLPLADLVHIDGDHSEEGCLADLYLASECAHLILCDDYSDPANGVRAACGRFLASRSDWQGEEQLGGRYLRLRKVE